MKPQHPAPPAIVRRIKAGVRSLVRRIGYDIVRLPPPADPRYEQASHDAARELPPGAAQVLRADHPRLLELRARYARLDLPMAQRTIWSSNCLGSELNLAYFRGDNPYVWQFRNVGEDARRKYYLFLRDIASRDRYHLLERLREDGLFGCWTFEYPGWPTVSRDLLDSINELYFLDEHVGLLRRRGMRVLDIGAGYGRLAHRTLAAAPELGAYLCTDAVPESTFLCEFYLRFHSCGPRAEVLPLDELDARLQDGKIDLAVNVHSFSEMSIAAVDGWVSRLAGLHVPWLFIVPNDGDRLLTMEQGGRRQNFEPLLAEYGYELSVKKPAFEDPTLREFMGGVTDHFFLYRRHEAGT